MNLLYPNEPSRFIGSEFEKFVLWAVENNTSDITIQNEEYIVCEIHGKMVKVTKKRLTLSEVTDIISFIYKSDGAIARLNAGEDVDNPWIIKVSRFDKLRFRVNMTAGLVDGQRGYQITIRTIKTRAPLLEDMNLPHAIVDAMVAKQGLILLAGSTGSGKSTLLASVLDWRIRQPNANLKVLTYEAPIEYVYDEVEKPSSSIFQSEIGVHLKDFSRGVRNALRRKPSIILLGEMRDRETIGEGITASLTGHLVYGTVHANGVAETPRRMVNEFAAEERNSRALDILSSLKLVVAQMLIPSKDGKRVALREYLVFNEEIADFILAGGVENMTYNTRLMLKKHGVTFLVDATEKFNQGLIDEHQFLLIKKLTQSTNKDIEENTEIKDNDLKDSDDKEWEKI